jgi:NADH dehydrogenase
MDFAGDRSARADRGRPLASRFASPTWRRSRTSTSSSGLGADVNVFGAEGAADVVGGGPTGVETARAVAEIYRAEPAKDYPEISQEETRVTLVEAGPGLFSMFKLKLREYATKALTARTVDVRTGVAAVGRI